MNYYNFLVLIVVVAILAIFAWRGYSSGLIKMLVSVIALAATVLLAGLLVKPVGNFVRENTEIYQGIEDSILKVIENYSFDEEENIKQLPFPEYIVEQVLQETTELDGIQQKVANAVAEKIFYSIVYLALNIAVFVGIRIMISVFQIVSYLPVIKEVNHMAGLVVGLAEGLLIIWLVALLLQAFAGEAWVQEVFRQINESEFLTFIYQNNLLLKLLG